MIDDEKLQELLGKASSLYNGGQYREAIEAWQAALAIDPANQKASEGVRMATLLLGDWEPIPGATGGDPQPPADGGDAGGQGLNPEEIEAGLALGLAQVRQLIAGRKYEEAIEQARSLQAQASDNEDIQRLLDEAQTGFEAQPFVQEHLTLARELLAQERYAEAEAECKRVFVLDREHPDGQALLKEIRSRIQKSLQRAAQQMGGMTVKLSVGNLGSPAPPAAPHRPAPAAAAQPTVAPPASPPAADDPFDLGDSGFAVPGPAPQGVGIAPAPADPDSVFEVSEGVGGRPAAAPSPAPEGAAAPGGQASSAFSGVSEFDLPATDGDLAGSQEDVASRNLLEEAFAGIDSGAAPAAPAPETADEAFATPPAMPPEVVEAKTVVKPSVRLVPPAPKAGEMAATTSVASTPRAPAAPAAPAKKDGTGAHGGSSWEDELSQLNAKEGERGMTRGSAKKGAAPAAGKKGTTPGKAAPPSAPDPLADLDLMSLLDNDIGIPGSAGSSPVPSPAPAAPTVAPGRAGQAATTMHTPPPRPAAAKGRSRAAETVDVGTPMPSEHEEPVTQTKIREHSRPAPPSPRPRSSTGKFFLLFVLLLIVGGGAAWWFFFQPRMLSGASLRDLFGASPPGGSAPASLGGDAPIPTPIGATGRSQDQEQDAAVAGLPAEAGNVPAGDAPASPEGIRSASPAGSPPPVGPGGPAAKPLSNEPIKPREQPALSPAEARRRITIYMADGRRLMQVGKWREARAKLGAVLALDPANLEAKEMLDTAQEKIDAEQKILDEFESTRRLYNEKDYENALRKLYRLPRDKGLGDIDLYIQNTWYSWAVVLLKAGNCRDALQKLSEVLVMDPDDAEALKLQEVAERYQNRAKDKVFYAFADALHVRPMDAR